jgi:hypothetical protein
MHEYLLSFGALVVCLVVAAAIVWSVELPRN